MPRNKGHRRSKTSSIQTDLELDLHASGQLLLPTSSSRYPLDGEEGRVWVHNLNPPGNPIIVAEA